MESDFLRADEATRRRFLSGMAGTFLGVGLLPGFAGRGLMAVEGGGNSIVVPELRRNPAKKVIYLYMSGGMSHLDTFNPRPDADEAVRGGVESIPTNADGVRVSEYLPMLAKHMDKAVVFNSLQSSQGAHQQGRYLMRTNYTKRGTIEHPHLGAWHVRLAGRINKQLPGFVSVAGGSNDIGAGYLDSTYEPLAIRDPKAGLRNARHYGNVGEELFNRRMELADKLDAGFRNRYNDRNIKAYSAMYEDAVRLMRSEDLAAFDLSKEPEKAKERYGEHPFGQGCLLARRLAENGVRFVEVNLGGWDTHADNFERVPERAAMLDQSMSALLEDLSASGQLDETMVVLATEFGRTPKVNQNKGRDHFPKCFSSVIAGGGIRGGRTYGSSNADGSEPDENPLKIRDFNATIAYGLGLQLDEVIHSPSRRPFTIANKGKAVTELFPG